MGTLLLRSISLLLIVLLFPLSLSAAVDLVTVPERRAVELTIYNSADLTLVRDRRLLTFQRGLNVLQFTWSNTLIDPSSLELRFRTRGETLRLLDTVFPPGREDALQWTVESDLAGDAEVEITYFTSGISWASRYIGHITSGDTRLDLNGDVQITNHSGEDYPRASVRLIVGSVHLVEEVAQLARNRGGWGKLAAADRDRAYRSFAQAEKRAQQELEMAREGAGAPAAPKGIVKQGLSEYFLFEIEGTETIPHGWSKSLNSVLVKDIPLKLTFRQHDGHHSRPHRILRFDNKSVNDRKDKTNLGLAPLPGGTVHVFRRDEEQNLSFLARLGLPYVPMGDKCELDLGAQAEVSIERVLQDYRRENIVFREKRVRSYDEVFTYRTTLRNALPFLAALEVERHFPAEAEIDLEPYRVVRVDQNRFRIEPDLEAGEEVVFEYTVRLKHRRF